MPEHAKTKISRADYFAYWSIRLREAMNEVQRTFGTGPGWLVEVDKIMERWKATIEVVDEGGVE